jgi:hypothetical protein
VRKASVTEVEATINPVNTTQLRNSATNVAVAVLTVGLVLGALLRYLA